MSANVRESSPATAALMMDTMRRVKVIEMMNGEADVSEEVYS